MLKLRLGEYLKEHKISMLYVSKSTGLRYNTVWDYCKGNINSPDLENIYKIMRAINIKDTNLIFEFNYEEEEVA